MDTTRNLIGGQWVEAIAGDVLVRRNPADRDEVVARYPAMAEADVAVAMDAAASATDDWRDLGSLGRGRVLLDAAALLRADAESVAADITRENGKTLAEARAEVTAAANFFEYFGGLGRGHWGELLADRRPGVDALTLREPLGVVALITPWNDPLVTPARKLAPALIAGNTVVLKPANETPLSAYHLARVLAAAGLPPGVLNVVTGRAGDLAPRLLGDPRLRAVSFTGSTAVGMRLRQDLAGTTVRLQTEMGGKNASLVLADADLPKAADTVISAAYGQCGQRCTATSRVVVDSEVYSEFVRLLRERATAMRVGPGHSDDVDLGALVSEEHLSSVAAALVRAEREGGTVHGGRRLTDGPLERGNFMSPAVVTDVPRAGQTWHEEIFGPVLAVAPVDGLTEGIAAVNEGRYGLAAAVFTRDLRAALTFVHSVDAGQVAVNLPTPGWDVHVPFGGFKESGSPFKEHGEEALGFYTRVKSAVVGYAP